MTDKIWSLINDIVFDLHSLNSNLVSEEKAKSITDKLERHLGDGSLIKLLTDFTISK